MQGVEVLEAVCRALSVFAPKALIHGPASAFMSWIYQHGTCPSCGWPEARRCDGCKYWLTKEEANYACPEPGPFCSVLTCEDHYYAAVREGIEAGVRSLEDGEGKLILPAGISKDPPSFWRNQYGRDPDGAAEPARLTKEYDGGMVRDVDEIDEIRAKNRRKK